MLSLSSVATALQRGYSIVMNKVQSSVPRVQSVVDELQLFFGHKVNANLYVTPVGHQAFDAHFDWMDVLVIQLKGCKNWKVYKPPSLRFPQQKAVRKPSPEAMEAMDVLVDTELPAGSILYIPSGFLHEAASNCSRNEEDMSMSVHLTLGIESVERSSLEALLLRWLDHLRDRIIALPFSCGADEDQDWKMAVLKAAVRLAAEQAEAGMALRRPLTLSQSVYYYSNSRRVEEDYSADSFWREVEEEVRSAVDVVFQFVGASSSQCSGASPSLNDHRDLRADVDWVGNVQEIVRMAQTVDLNPPIDSHCWSSLIAGLLDMAFISGILPILFAALFKTIIFSFTLS